MAVKVLIADSQSLFSQSVANLIDSENQFEVVAFSSEGRETLLLIDEINPDVLVISDKLQGLNGIETVRAVMEKNVFVKVLMLIQGNDRSSIFRALNLGIHGCVSKQADVEELLIAIREINLGNSYLSTGISKIVFEELSNNRGNHPEIQDSVLSPRALEVLQLLAEGKSSKEIGDILHISSKTVDWHRSQIMKKLRIQNFAGLVKYAINEGLTTASVY